MNVRNGWSKRMELLKYLTSEWPGDPVDGDGLARILNRGGTRPPLIWCFNEAKGFPMMAAGLGPDQPLIGLHSLHMVEPLDTRRYGKDEMTAEHYAEVLLSSASGDLDECFIGGNCQGAGIAAHIASSLLEANKNVRALITMESQSPLPFPARVGLIFGARSEMFNPFLRGESPEGLWSTLFQEPILQIIPGSHGEYFNDENFPALRKAILKIIGSSHGSLVPPKPPMEISMELIDPPASLKAGSRRRMRICSNSTILDDPEAIGPVVAYFLWTSLEHGVSKVSGTRPLPIHPAGGIDTASAVVETPAESGDWILRVFACRESDGPILWSKSRAPTCFVRVE